MRSSRGARARAFGRSGRPSAAHRRRRGRRRHSPSSAAPPPSRRAPPAATPTPLSSVRRAPALSPGGTRALFLINVREWRAAQRRDPPVRRDERQLRNNLRPAVPGCAPTFCGRTCAMLASSARRRPNPCPTCSPSTSRRVCNSARNSSGCAISDGAPVHACEGQFMRSHSRRTSYDANKKRAHGQPYDFGEARRLPTLRRRAARADGRPLG